MLHLALFILFGAICVGGAINLLRQTHPIDSALSLVVVMGALAGLYLLLGAEFLAAIQVIVYAGAIMVLFVFVIMLLNAGEEEHTRGSKVALLLGVPGLIIGGVLATWVVLKSLPSEQMVGVGSLYGGAHDIGHLLFKDFLLPFEITSVLILIAIMGAVVLARRESQ
jgi:NADH-quinone oxidoreductase subunit J